MSVSHTPQRRPEPSAALSAEQRHRRRQDQARRGQAYQRRVTLERREGSRLDRSALWFGEASAERFLNRPLGSLFTSFQGLLAASLLCSLLVGFLFDYSMHLASLGSIGGSTTAVAMLIGGAVGAAAGGGAGGRWWVVPAAACATLWVWLAGKIAETLVSTLTTDPLARSAGEFAGWCLAYVLGWSAALVVEGVYEKFHGGTDPSRVVKLVLIGVVAAAIAQVLWNVAYLFRHNARLLSPEVIVPWIGHRPWIIMTLIWLGGLLGVWALWEDRSHRFWKDRPSDAGFGSFLLTLGIYVAFWTFAFMTSQNGFLESVSGSVAIVLLWYWVPTLVRRVGHRLVKAVMAIPGLLRAVADNAECRPSGSPGWRSLLWLTSPTCWCG